MPAQVDWNWQISNKPVLFPGAVDNVPSTGPYTGSPILFTPSTGIEVSAGPIVDLLLASLTQQGVIGTAGGQVLGGPFYFAPAGSHPGLPSWGSYTASYPVVILGDLALYTAAQEPISSPATFLALDPGDSLSMTLQASHSLTLVGSPGDGPPDGVRITNGYTGGYLTFQNGYPYTLLFDPQVIQLQVFNNQKSLTLNPFGPGGLVTLELLGIGTNSAYVCDGDVGQTGIDAAGTHFHGGIAFNLGSGSLGGDLSGTLSSATLQSIQGNPVSGSGSITVGDALTWNGSAWAPAPGGSGGVITINTADSITGGPITSTGTLTLLGDVSAPLASQYYGTDSGGTRGWYNLPGSNYPQVLSAGNTFISNQPGATSGTYVAATAPAGTYRVSCVLAVNTSGAGQVSLTLQYTDEFNIGQNLETNFLPLIGTGQQICESWIIRNGGISGQAISWVTNYSGTGSYDLATCIEQLF